jgi:hypothetical protein
MTPGIRGRGVQTVLKELPDDRAVNLVCKDASGQTWPGPRHRLILDDQRHVVDCGGTDPVRDRFPYPGKQGGRDRPKSSPGNQQAISFVWCA